MPDHSSRFLDLVDEARKGIREATIDDVKPRMERGDSFVLVDVREESEYAAGHLPGAVHLSKGVIERDIERAIPDPDVEIILYCGGGFRSALTAESLMKMGYRNVISMDGGIRAWREAGYPLEM
jgi:rhodanese-related sulfurtransferase